MRLCGFYRSLWAFAAFKSKARCIILLHCFKSLNLDVPVEMTRGASIQPCLERSERGIKAFWSSAFDTQSRLSNRGIWYKILISICQKKAGEFKFSFSGWNACITTCSDTSVGSEESEWVSTWRPEADYHLLNMYRSSSLCIKSIWCWCPWLFNILDIVFCLYKRQQNLVFSSFKICMI